MEKKKFAAAIAAVFAYIKTSEEAVLISGVPELVQEHAVQSVQVQNNIWGISGRQIHMQANSMIQLRLFK